MPETIKKLQYGALVECSAVLCIALLSRQMSIQVWTVLFALYFAVSEGTLYLAFRFSTHT